MANVLLNSNGFSSCYCLQSHYNNFNFHKHAKSHDFSYRILHNYANFHVLNSCLCGVTLFYNSRKTPKSGNYKLRVASIEHGFVCQLGETPFSENANEREELFRRKLDSKAESFNDCLLDLKGDDIKLCYLEERNEGALSKRILSLSRANKCRSALELFWSMEFSGLKPDLHACNSLLACLVRNNMFDNMLRVFTIMRRDRVVSGHSFSLVLKAVAKYQGSDKALQLFGELEGDSETKQHFDAVVYNTMISICGKENKWVKMVEIWNDMKENGSAGTEVTYRILVCTFVRCGQYEIAIDAYAEMLHNGLEPGYDAMHAIIGAYSKEEKWDSALNVYRSMLSCGLKPNLIACNALINSLGKAGKLKEAFTVYKHIRSLGHTPDSYTWNALLGAFYRANQYANALQFFDNIQKEWNVKPNLQLYNTALMCCQRLGFWDKALQLLWVMESSEIPISSASYNIVIGACEVARKPKVALQVYEHMVRQKCTPDTFTHLSLIRSCIWGDLWDEVENILTESTPNVSLYNAAIHGMCLRGRIKSAKKLYIRMRDNGLQPDGKTRALMLQFMQKDLT